MNLKHIEHICLAVGFGVITGLVMWGIIDVNASQYIFENSDKKLSEAFSVFFYCIVLGTFAVHTVFNIINVYNDRREKKLVNTSSKEEAKQ